MSRECKVSVNVSGAQLTQPDFVESVALALHETGIDPARLCLEIPEPALVADIERSVKRLDALKELGVSLAIDRFGATAVSSLQGLARLPVDVIKIDRSYVLGLSQGARPRALLEGLIALAHTMGITPLAQGVQLDSEDTALRELGGDHAQGFRYSPPRPAEALDDVLGPGGGRRRGRRGAIRVLLCDDIPEMRDMVRVALEQEPDFEVVGEASDGEGAARGVAEHRPDVVLLDVSMPHVDGLEAIRRIRASGEDTAILVLSGFERQAMADTAIGLGADAYLEKRAALDEIRDTLRKQYMVWLCPVLRLHYVLLAQRVADLVERGALLEIGVGAEADRRVGHRLALEARQHEDRRVLARGADAPDGLPAEFDVGHRDVEQDDVGPVLGDAARGALAVAGLADDLEVGLLLERDADHVAHLGDVVAEQDADRAAPAAPAPAARAEHVVECLRRARRRVAEALGVIAAQLAQRGVLGVQLHALGQRRDAHRVREGDQALQQRARARALAEAEHVGAVDLDDVAGQPGSP